MNEPNEHQSRSERRAAGDVNERAAAIVHMCVKANRAGDAGDFIASSMTADAVARRILDEQLQGTSAPQSGGGGRHELPRSASRGGDELPRGYSLRGAILSAVEGSGSLEREWSDQYARSSGRSLRGDGMFVHPAALQPATRALTSFSAGSATELVQESPGELIEMLRPVAAVVRLGARVMSGLNGPVPFPKQTGSAVAQWVQENPGADVSESGPTFGSVMLAPKTLQGTTPFTRQLLTQSSINVESMVRNDLAKAHGLALDRAAIHGSGVGNEPMGLFKTPNVNTEAMGGAPDYAKLLSMLSKVASDNAYSGALGWLTTPGLAAKLMGTLEFASYGGKAIWTGGLLEGQVAGHKAAASTQVSALMSTLEPTGGTSHGLIFGNWNDVLIGLWGALELVVDPYTLAKRGMIQVTSFQMCDIALRHGESFCVGTGATA